MFVAPEQEDSRVSALARSLGARVIAPGGDRDLDLVFASYGLVVAMCGDGSHDPYLIPELLYGIREGHDASIVTASATCGPDESVRLLNNKPAAPDRLGLRRAVLAGGPESEVPARARASAS